MTADVDGLSRMETALDAVSAGVDLPPGDMRANPQAAELFDAVDQLVAERRFRGYPENDEAFVMVEEASKATENKDPLLLSALLRQNDHVFVGHLARGLSVFRLDFSGHGGNFGEREFELALVGDGLIPKSTRPDEVTLIGLYVETQVFVVNTDESQAVAESNERPLDDFDLIGSLADLYRMRSIRRVAWGSGSCLFTDQRMIGLLFDDEIDKRPDSTEGLSMPMSSVTGETSSAVAFEVERSQFEKREVSTGAGPVSKFFFNRIPILNLLGNDCHIAINSLRVVTSDGGIARPGKGEVDQAVLRFCGG